MLAGRYESGIAMLEPFLNTKYSDWWPLYYYLGVAYEMTGNRSEAVDSLKKALKLNGSHLETMKELLAIYEDEGDKANIRKYSNKIEMVQSNIKAEQDAHIRAIQEEDRKLEEEEPELADPEYIDIETEDDDTVESVEDPKEKKSLVRRLGDKDRK